MGFWIFILIMNLLIPIMMIGFGKYFSKNAPKQINFVWGYRTTRSMKNQETWQFAHHYIGKLWIKAGWTLLITSILPMFFVIGQNENTIGMLEGIISFIQIIFLTTPIFLTEKALKNTFDQQGNKINLN